MFPKIKISTLLAMSSSTKYTLMLVFSVFLVYKDISGPLWLFLISMNFYIEFHLLIKYAACHYFPKSKTIFFIPAVITLMVAFRGEVYCWKLRPFILVIQSIFVFSSIIPGYSSGPTFWLLYRFFATLKNNVEHNTDRDPDRYTMVGYMLWSHINVNCFWKNWIVFTYTLLYPV